MTLSRKTRKSPKPRRKARKPAASRSRPRRAAKPGRDAKRTLLPVLRPYHNAREVIKQLAMLEDHLNNADKRCTDCIHKHFLTSEGLAEELGSLCAEHDNRCDDLASQIRVLHHAWAQEPKDTTVILTVAQRLRQIRKTLMAKYSTLPLDKLPSNETEAVHKLVRECKGKKRATCAAKK